MHVGEGSVLGGRYELQGQLGRGGMGTVFRGRDRRLDREVAVKVLDPPLAADAAFLERFRREARAAASLQHHNVVAVFDGGEEDGAHYIVMEYVDGPTLQAVLRAEGPLDPNRAVALAAAVADALGAAHRIGLVHRDVKPSNVLVTPEGQVKVTDFGIARAASDVTLTAVDTVLGSVPFVAPEQVRGEPAQPASDVYALGCVLYALLTGRPPFEGDVAISVLHQHLSSEARPPSAYRPGLSESLDAVVLRLLAKEPGERPADGDAAAGLLRDPAELGAAATAALPIVPTEVIARTRALEPTRAVTPMLPDDLLLRATDDRADRPHPRWGRRLVLAAVLLAALLAAFALPGDRPPGDDPGTPAQPAEPVDPPADAEPDPEPEPEPEPEPSSPGDLIDELGELIGASRGGAMSDDAADELTEKLAKVAQEHDEQDWDEARSKTRELRRALQERTREGQVDEGVAAQLAAAVDALDAWFQQARTSGDDDRDEDRDDDRDD